MFVPFYFKAENLNIALGKIQCYDTESEEKTLCRSSSPSHNFEPIEFSLPIVFSAVGFYDS